MNIVCSTYVHHWPQSQRAAPPSPPRWSLPCRPAKCSRGSPPWGGSIRLPAADAWAIGYLPVHRGGTGVGWANAGADRALHDLPRHRALPLRAVNGAVFVFAGWYYWYPRCSASLYNDAGHLALLITFVGVNLVFFRSISSARACRAATSTTPTFASGTAFHRSATTSPSSMGICSSTCSGTRRKRILAPVIRG